MSSLGKKFEDFLKKLPKIDREFYLMVRMYEQSCENLDSISGTIESHIINTFSSSLFPVEKETREPSILTAIEKLDQEFDKKLGNWYSSESSSCDCSDCFEDNSEIPGETE